MNKQKKRIRWDYNHFWNDLQEQEFRRAQKGKLQRQILFTDAEGNILLFAPVSWRMKVKYLYLPKYLSLIRWILIDWIRGKQERIFGIWMFCGLFGEGKTISMVKYCQEITERNPDVKVYSNFYYKHGHGRIQKWQDLLTLPHRSIVMIDEIQNTFNSNDWRDFPKELLTQITQCRKKQVMILCTAQVYRRVAKQIRDLVEYVVQCNNWCKLDRLFRNHFYHSDEYEWFLTAKENGNPSKIQPFIRRSWVVTDEDYELYNTTEMVESLYNK